MQICSKRSSILRNRERRKASKAGPALRDRPPLPLPGRPSRPTPPSALARYLRKTAPVDTPLLPILPHPGRAPKVAEIAQLENEFGVICIKSHTFRCALRIDYFSFPPSAPCRCPLPLPLDTAGAAPAHRFRLLLLLPRGIPGFGRFSDPQSRNFHKWLNLCGPTHACDLFTLAPRCAAALPFVA